VAEASPEDPAIEKVVDRFGWPEAIGDVFQRKQDPEIWATVRKAKARQTETEKSKHPNHCVCDSPGLADTGEM
jgi:hypothetical protein